MMKNINQYYNMETTIIALLVVALAVLLAYIIITGRKYTGVVDKVNDQSKDLPDIIGRPKSGTIYNTKSNTNQSHIGVMDEKEANLQLLITESPAPSPMQGTDELSGSLPDLEEEEEEMQRISAFNTEGGLATGITFDELANAAKLLQRHTLETSEKENAAEVFSKIDGTELLNLLESKIGDASRRIAVLLDQKLQ